jgi:transcription termination factor Rho
MYSTSNHQPCCGRQGGRAGLIGESIRERRSIGTASGSNAWQSNHRKREEVERRSTTIQKLGKYVGFSMALGIAQHGIVHRRDDGTTAILRPGRRGGAGIEVEVPKDLAEEHRLATGDVVEGPTEPVASSEPETSRSDEVMEDEASWDEQFDEPPAARNVAVPLWLTTRCVATERLTSIMRINGLPVDRADDRPLPRTRRSHTERVPPDQLVPLATGPTDATGRILDFAAPLGLGSMGLIRGPHGSGLTRTLATVLNGIVAHAPQIVPIVLLLRARAEEVTEWRRQFPRADVVLCPSALGEVTPDQTLRAADLVLEAAQRQTELGRDVALLVDSLTGLWGTMLEAEEADSQAQADQSGARRLLREWVQKAGCFHGETPLGGSLGGSLTIIGTVWDQSIDEEAEEEREVHPHLRLMEHIVHDASWRVVLSEALAARRWYPAIDVKQCLSSDEGRLLPPDMLDRLLTARGKLPRRDPVACHRRLMAGLDAAPDFETLLDLLADS